MSGHSKWATIKRKKGKLDAQRGKLFTKLIREITVAARDGGGDPDSNAHLRLIIDKAKAANMPHDNITRAVKKGTGELEGASYEAIRYEGYAPGGVALIVETLTDNKNRTVSEVRHVFSKLGGNLGETGSLGWMFERKGVVVVSGEGLSEDVLLEKFIDYDVEDITELDGEFTVVCDLKDLHVLKEVAANEGFNVETADMEWIAKEPAPVSEAIETKALKFIEALDDLDDVQGVYSNLP